MAIVIKNIKGMIPLVSPKLLPDNFAQIAKNCDLKTGRLKPLKDLLTSQTWAVGAVGALRSLYKEESTDKWLYWTEADINIVKAQVADGNNRLVYTGDGYPKQTDNTLMPSTGSPAGGTQCRRLGVTPPSTALTINGPYGTGDDETKHSVSYYYTYVCKWDDGTEEESKPVAATAVIDVEGGEYLALSGFVKPTLAASGNDVTHFRVYRLNSGDAGAEYQLAKMRPGSTGAAAVDDLPVADVPLPTTLVYDCNAAVDDLNSDLGEVCPTSAWGAPPDDLAQIGQYQNGILAGFSGKQFCVSRPFVHYSWLPSVDRPVLNYTPVAWGVYRGMAIVATTAFPAIITGADSSTLMQETLPYSQRCESARGFVITDIGALYPSPDGLVLINESSVKVLTKKVFTKAQWAELPPDGFSHADLVSFYYDNVYIGFWAGSGHGFIFNFKDDPYITTFEVADTIYHACIDPTDDTLYLLTLVSTNYHAKAWNSAETYLTNTFKSKIFTTPPTTFSFAKIVGNQNAGTPVTFKLFGNGSQIQHNEANWSKSVQSIDIFRLPAGQRYESHEIEISGQAEVDFVILANSGKEIAEIMEGMG